MILPEVGNGYLATVVGSDTIYVAGMFSGDSRGIYGDVSHRARIPSYHVFPTANRSQGYGRVLDMQNACFEILTALPNVTLFERWYAPFQEKHLLVHEMHFTSLIDNDSVTIELTLQETKESDDLNVTRVYDGIMNGTQRIPETRDNYTIISYARSRSIPSTLTLGPSESFQISLLTAIAIKSEPSDPDPIDVVRELIEKYEHTNTSETLFVQHCEMWNRRSEYGRIEVAGDLNLAAAVNASLYFLRSSLRSDTFFGISPGGLASNGYHGHVFWDQETWMYPPMLLLEPASAEAMLQYRFLRLNEAREKAQNCVANSNTESYCQDGIDMNSEAVMFPWESAVSGKEVQYSNGLIGNWGKYEQHITGDIALAVKMFYTLTQNVRWLEDIGFPILNGTASFFASRIEDDTINFVMPPDEYACPVNSSAYTNSVAKIALSFASEASKILNLSQEDDSPYEHFRQLSENILIPFDAKNQFHPEYLPFDTSKEIKQADAVLLAFPLSVNMTQEALRNDLDVYSKLTSQKGPAMTWSSFAIDYFSLEDFETSKSYFLRGFANVQPPFNVWTETPSGGTVNFLTGAGGFLQSLVFGTSGLRIQHDGSLRFKAPPPRATGTNATTISLHSFHYLGARLRQSVNETHVHFEVLETPFDVSREVDRIMSAYPIDN